MTRPLRLSTAAKQDVSAAKDWYARQDVPYLDLRFQRELDGVFEQMEAFPGSFAVVYKDVRQANLRRFPYAVFYHLRNETPYVLAVIHHARHPRVWKRRWKK